ncbi:MAG: hypothetical protein ABI723_26000 [Bacteroidia bacterium]
MNKQLLKSLLVFAFATLCSINVMAQDIIYKKDKTTIKAKISEVGLDEIKYWDFDNLDGPQFIMSKDEISKIVFSNGREMIITPDPYSASGDVDIRDKTHVVKFEFFSPLTQDIAFGYEYMIRVGLNVEGKIGIIGPGLSANDNHAAGAFVKIGPKFLLSTDYVMHGMQYSHAMRGRYLKPEISVSIYAQDMQQSSGYGGSAQTDRIKYGSYGISLVYGRQAILGKVATIDWYFGMGYAFHTADIINSTKTAHSGNNYYSDIYKTQQTYDYSHIYFGKSVPLIMSAGITLGYLW